MTSVLPLRETRTWSKVNPLEAEKLLQGAVVGLIASQECEDNLVTSNGSCVLHIHTEGESCGGFDGLLKVGFPGDLEGGVA